MVTYRINGEGGFDRVNTETGALAHDFTVVECRRRSSVKSTKDDDEGKYMRIAIKSQRHFTELLNRLPLPPTFYVLVVLMLVAGVVFATLGVIQRIIFKSIYDQITASIRDVGVLTAVSVQIFEASSWMLQAALLNKLEQLDNPDMSRGVITAAETYPANLSSTEFLAYTKEKLNTLYREIEETLEDAPLHSDSEVYKMVYQTSSFIFIESGAVQYNISILSCCKLVFPLGSFARPVAAQRPLHDQQV